MPCSETEVLSDSCHSRMHDHPSGDKDVGVKEFAHPSGDKDVGVKEFALYIDLPNHPREPGQTSALWRPCGGDVCAWISLI